MKKLLTAVLAAALCSPVMTLSAEEADTGKGIEFDFNRDGVTDRNDWEEMQAWAKEYMIRDEAGNTYYSSQELPASVNLLLEEQYPGEAAPDYGIDLSAWPEYYLTSLGGTTPVKSQGAFGACWAFGTINAVESNLLLKRSGLLGTLDSKGTTMNLSNAADTIDLSELYHAYTNEVTVPDGPQKGEGTDTLENDDNKRIGIGSFPAASQQILTSWNGPLTEEQEPYEPLYAEEDGTTIYGLKNPDTDRTTAPAAHVQKYIYLDSPVIINVNVKEETYDYAGLRAEAIERMKQAVVKYGSLMLCYGADMSLPGETGNSDYMNYETWSQYNDSDQVPMNHMVSIVGWNDSFSKENFKTEKNELPPADGAFLIKNSWGDYDYYSELIGQPIDEFLADLTDPTEKAMAERSFNYGIRDKKGHGTGYAWVSYYDHSLLNISALDTDDASDGFDYDHIYQYDFARQAALMPISLPAAAETKTANRFKAERTEALAAVSVYTPRNNCTAKIQVYRLNSMDDAPDAGTLLYETETVLPESGFQTAVLDAPVVLQEGEIFAVVEQISSQSGSETIGWLNLESVVREDLQTPGNVNEQTLTVVSNPGESAAWVKTGDAYEWVEPETLSQEADAGMLFHFGNAYIKAYTTDALPEAAAQPAQSSTGSVNPYVAAGLILVCAGIVYYLLRRKKQ